MVGRRLHTRLGIAAAVVLAGGLLLPPEPASASPTSVTTYGYGLRRTGYDGAETAVGVSNAGTLHEIWSFDLGGVSVSEPMFAAGVNVNGTPTDLVITGSEGGSVYAVDASTGLQVWSSDLGTQITGCDDMPSGQYGVSSTAAIDLAAGRVYVAGADGYLHALDLATGAEVAGWPMQVTSSPDLEYVYSAITLSRGELYVETASYCDATPYHGRIVEIDAATHAVVHRWYVTGANGPDGGGIWGQAGLSVDSAGNVYTATGNAMTSPENAGKAEAVVRLTSSLSVLAYDKPNLTGYDVDFGGSPMLFHRSGCPVELAVENKSGVLLLYKAASIASGSVQRLQVGSKTDWQFNAIPAFDPVTNMLYVTDSSDSANYAEGLMAFHVRPSCTLAPTPAWHRPGGPGYWISMGPPIVANGVVYDGDGTGDTLRAYDAATGTKLWGSGSTISGAIFSAPLVAYGVVYVDSFDASGAGAGRLYAFAPS